MTIYISGGKLGDFIQQMSIIYERFLLDKKPAILYISERGDKFRHGVKRAYTDLLPIVSKQPYIKEFKIHNGEQYDIDLSRWRRHIYVDKKFMDDYLTWMKKEYNIDWGKNKWIFDIPCDAIWKDKIVINTTSYRFPDIIDWKIFFNRIDYGNILFVGFDKNEHDHFVKNAHKINYYCPHSLEELFTIINSCKLFIGSLSAPLSIAFSIHTPTKIGFYKHTKRNFNDYKHFHNIGQNIPSVLK